MVRILGAGPAGSAAAIAALQAGAGVEIFERSRLPRHKVCGEFLTPEIAAALDALDAWSEFDREMPARVDRAALWFGTRRKTWKLAEAGWGLSRYTLDLLLLRRAERLGAVLRGGGFEERAPAVLASGRAGRAQRGVRRFGFKAHFSGPADSAVELFFFEGGYVGVSAVERGLTNVCGLAREDLLAAHGFDFDELTASHRPLAERLRPLSRTMKWLAAGPVTFERRFRETPGEGIYPAGDALAFVDPFTGTGITAALVTGRLAGTAAARGLPAADHLAACRRALQRPFAVAAVFRAAVESGWAERVAPINPAGWLFSLTRPRVAA